MTTTETGQRPEIALVTGANKGIGKEIVRQLAATGAVVYLGARDEQRGRQAERELAGEGLDVRFVQLDVTVGSQVEAATKRVDAEAGRLDLLVNNAGVVVEWGVSVPEVTADLLRTAFEVNVFGAVATTQACLPLLRRSPRPRVVNMSSPLGSLSLLSEPDNPISSRGLLAYSASKAALNAITLLYANALQEHGIQVNAANPGLVPTDLNVASPFSRGTLTPEQGAAVAVRLAMLGPGGPTGAFRAGPDAGQTVPW